MPSCSFLSVKKWSIISPYKKPCVRPYTNFLLALLISLVSLLPDALTQGEALINPNNRYVQIEKRGGKISDTYRVEQTIRFQLKGDEKGWYSKVIRDFNFDNNAIVFQDGEVPLEQIALIQSDQKGFFGRFIPGFLMFSGVNSILGSVTLWIINGFDFPRLAVISGVASAVVGFILRLITKKKVYHINDTQILRLIDLNLY